MTEKTITIPVTGMSCANCALTIERTVRKLAGVKAATVNFATEQVSLSFDPEQVQVEKLVEKIQDAGYGVAKTTVDIPVTGMTCANCAMTIERTLKKKVPGVVNASVNFASERARVEYIPSLTGLDEMIQAIEKAGYGAVRPDDTLEGDDAELQARRAEIRDQTVKFAVGLVFTIPLFILSMGRDFGLFGSLGPRPVGQLALPGARDPGPVLHRVGLLHRGMQEPPKPKRQHGCAGGHGVVGGLSSTPSLCFFFPLSDTMSTSRPRR